ncbi:MAG TPA: tetratricopeptide repeat protein [Ignavibacteriaceae bacterium]|nr:tetratricopeptide repeat protein [Ignavibacteriaceae bacterium]
MEKKEASFHKGLAEFELDKYFEAIDDFNIYLAEHPNALEAIFNRGVAYNKSGNPESAIKDFNKVIELNPNHEKAFFERAFAKKKLEDLVGYSNDLKESYNKGYLHAYHFLKET